MHNLFSCFLMLSTLLITTTSRATTVQVVASQAEVIHQLGSASLPNITLQLESTSADVSPEVLIWQLGLEILPSDEATGTVGFLMANEPTDYLFAGSSTPMSFPSLPQPVPPSTLDISDANILAPSGTALLFGNPINVIDLLFEFSNDAEGVFQLVLAPFSTSPIGSSSWSPELVLNPIDAMEFANAKAGSNEETRVIASINVLSVPEPISFIMLVAGVIGRFMFRSKWN